MTEEERRKAIEEMTNDIVNNMSLAEMMAIIVQKAKESATLKVDNAVILHPTPPKEKKSTKTFWQKFKKFFTKKRHKGFSTKKS
jgi:hypothetical protein